MATLFSKGDLTFWLDRLRADAAHEVDRWPAEEVRSSPSAVVDEIVARYSLAPVAVDFQRLSRSEVREIQTYSGQFGDRVRFDGQSILISAPVEGESSLLEYKASSAWVNFPGGDIENGSLTFEVRGAPLTKSGVDDGIARMRKLITDAATWANSDVQNSETAMRINVQAAADARKERLDHAAALSADLDIPISPSPSSRRVEVPVARKTVRIIDQGSSPSVDEPRLADAMYEDVLRTINALAHAFERLPKTAAHFKEEELRDLILFVLNANYEGLARGEVFNGSGKTDILLPFKDRNAFIAECKVWTRPGKFSDALDQLLGYTVWRDTKGALILFIKAGDATKIISAADEIIRTHAAFRSAQRPKELAGRHDYLVTATSDSQRYVRLAFLPFVIPVA